MCSHALPGASGPHGALLPTPVRDGRFVIRATRRAWGLACRKSELDAATREANRHSARQADSANWLHIDLEPNPTQVTTVGFADPGRLGGGL